MTRTVKLEVTADVKGAVNGLKTLGQATKDSAREFDSWAAKNEQSLDVVSKGMMGFGAMAAGGAALAVTKFASFDKAMSSVQAATHESTTNMGLLRQAAIDAGADTAFSAEEAASGIEELAKAGVSTADIMGGGLTGSLDLAAAGALGVGEAAEISATALTQFKLSGDQIPHLADLLAAGAGKAQGSVSDLGAALNQSGLVASATGLSIEETTGTLAAFASAGLIGSDAGTAFKSMLQRLQNPSEKAAGVMADLGINMYDANGEFAGMDVLAGQLSSSLANKSAAERDAAMSTIFGSDAVRAANVLYQQGAEGITDWTNKVNDAGYAAETAAIMQNNLSGDLEKLGGAFDTVFIQSGGAANEALRGLVQTAESVVDMVGKIPAPILGIGTLVGGLAGGALLLGGGLISVLPKIRDTRDALSDLFPAGSKAADGLGKAKTGLAGLAKGAGIAGGIMAVGFGIAKLASMSYTGNIVEGTGHIAKAMQDIIDRGPAAEGAIDAAFRGADGGDITTGLGSMNDAIETLFADDAGSRFNRWGQDVVNAIAPIPGSVSMAEDAFGGLDTELSNLVNSGDADGAAQAMAAIQERLDEAGVSAEQAAYLFPQYSDALNKAAAAEQAASGGAGELTGALGEVGAEAEEVAASLDDILASLFELGRDTRSVIEAEDALTGSLTALKDSMKENGKEFEGNSKAALDNRAALVGVAADMESVIEAQARGGASSGEIAATMKGTYDAMMVATGGSEELVRSLLSIPPGVNVETFMDDQARSIAAGTADAIEAIPGYKKVEIVVSEDGTVAQVQSKVNEVTGKTEYVLVSEDGTTAKVQAGIANIKGKDVPVWVDDNGTVYAVDGKIKGIKGKNVTIVADAATAAAEAALNNTARNRSSLISQRIVTTKETHISTGPGGRGGQSAFASGGSVFGAGTEKSDSIPAWLSNNEHVLTAAEVRGLGGHSAVERLRAMARSGGAPAFAKGGQVGAAESKVKSTKRSYDLIDGKKANRLRKLAAKDQWEAAKKELAAVKKSSKASADAAKKSAEARKKAAEDEKARQGRLSESRRDLSTDLRRGEITDAFTSGSGMGQVDKLREASRSTDYSASKRKGLARDANALEKSLTILTKKSENLKTALEAATSQADELRSVRDSVAGDLRGEFSLSGMLSTSRQDLGANPFTAKGIIGTANKKAKRIEVLADRLKNLRRLGYGESIIQEVAGLGVEEGITVAGVLMSATKGERNAIVGAYKRLDTASDSAGQRVTESMYKGGSDAADGLVEGLESKSRRVNNAFYKLGKDAEKSFRKSLDMHSPSRVMALGGADSVDGVVVGLDRNKSKLVDAFGALGDAGSAAFSPQLSVPPSAEVARYAAQPAHGGGVDTQAIANAVAGAIASYQPIVNIDGRKFYGVMQAANQQARRR